MKTLLIGISLTFIFFAHAEQPNAAKPDGKPSYTIDYDAKKVVKYGSVGTAGWSVSFTGNAGLVRPPHIVWDAQRVYFTLDGGVTALDANNGKELWRSEGPNERLLLSGDLLVASGGYRDNWSVKWLVARSPVDGKEKFKLQLPKDSDPMPITEMGKLFVVLDDDHDKIGMKTMLVDRSGVVRASFDKQLVSFIMVGCEFIILTDKDVVHLSAELKELWSIPFPQPQWVAGGSFLELPDGDVIAYRYGCINDSGVDLLRLEAKAGKLVWSTHCERLGVFHSEYYHKARATIVGDTIVVESHGSGTFTETLDLATGKQLTRKTDGK